MCNFLHQMCFTFLSKFLNDVPSFSNELLTAETLAYKWPVRSLEKTGVLFVVNSEKQED